MVSKMDHCGERFMPVNDKKPYKLLQIDSMVREVEWLIAIHSNEFLCANETIPCHGCTQRGRILAPLFLIGIEGAAEAIKESPLRLARLAIDKMSAQRWSKEPAWKKDKKILEFNPSQESR